MTIFRDLSEERDLVESFTRPAESLLPISRFRHGAHDERATWRQMAELGWLGIGLPEKAGGVGLTILEDVLAAQTLGRHLLPPAFPATILAAHAFLQLEQEDRTADLISGKTRATLAVRARNGNGLVIFNPKDCDYLVLLTDGGLEIMERPDLTAHDDVHWGCPVALAEVTTPAWSLFNPDYVRAARLLIAAILAGIATEACARGVEYAKVREQFGQPIGAFQAVKHHCANMAIAAYGARELITFAALCAVEGAADANHLAQTALNFALRTARDNAGTNIQIHGGMGFSDECDAHLFLKAARVLDAAVGGIDAVRHSLMRAA